MATTIVLLWATLFCLVAAADAVAQPGQLDAAFAGGKVSTSVSALDRAAAVTIQPDGKIVVVGRTASSGATPGDFAIARYHPNGTLDGTFDGDGKVTTDFYGFDDGATAVALQADGKIVAAGFASFIGAGDGEVPGRHSALARYDSTGTLDETFGLGGKVTLDRAPYWNGMCSSVGIPLIGTTGVRIQPDGKIVVSLLAYAAFGEGGALDGGMLAAARFDSSGFLDPTLAGPNPGSACGVTPRILSPTLRFRRRHFRRIRLRSCDST